VRVATGYAKWGISKGAGAGLALAGEVLGRTPAWVEPFDPRRIDAVRAPRELASLNASVGWHLVTDQLKTLGRDVPPLAEGEAVVVRTGLVDRTGVANVEGRPCVSAICPHLGGVLAWNPAEQSWDCPLHGSRFAADGRLLQGPAVEDLEARPCPDGFSEPAAPSGP
jgi:nitrite reductase/ring-hydroxylating ferredoxin subunit